MIGNISKQIPFLCMYLTRRCYDTVFSGDDNAVGSKIIGAILLFLVRELIPCAVLRNKYLPSHDLYAVYEKHDVDKNGF